jgi:hypothetical protein
LQGRVIVVIRPGVGAPRGAPAIIPRRRGRGHLLRLLKLLNLGEILVFILLVSREVIIRVSI